MYKYWKNLCVEYTEQTLHLIWRTKITSIYYFVVFRYVYIFPAIAVDNLISKAKKKKKNRQKLHAGICRFSHIKDKTMKLHYSQLQQSV